MENKHWKTNPNQLTLFDRKQFIVHRYVMPKVVEVRFGQPDRDTFIDDLETDEVRANIFDLPRRIPPKDSYA